MASLSVGEVGSNIVHIEGILREPDVQVWLSPIIESVHRSAVRAALAEVILDIRKLEYANAAAWRCLVQWLHLIHRDVKANYTLRIRSQPAYRWQVVGMSTLRIFGDEHLIIE